MHSESVDVNTHLFDRPFPFFSAPSPLGEYCVDRERRVHTGRGRAAYLYESNVGVGGISLDLNLGNEGFKEKKGDEKLDVFLQWINSQSSDGEHLKKVLHEADFVCWRGLLTRIAATPYSMRDDWKFVAKRVNGVTFLNEMSTEAQIQRKSSMTPRDHLMTYWGFKFEQYMTTHQQGVAPDTTVPLCLEEELGVVVKSRLAVSNGKVFNLVYSGEVDAINNAGDLVELKTQRHALEGNFWRQKSLKWWLQSFLIGIKNIVVGYRDDHGFVKKVDTVHLEDLPRSGQWRGNVCFNFLGTVLEKVDSVLSNSTSASPSCLVVFHSHQKRVSVDVVPNGEDRFLSEPFKQHFRIEDN